MAGCDAAGVLELVEPALDEGSQPVADTVHGHAQPAGLAYQPHRRDGVRLDDFSNLIRIIAAIRRRDARLWQRVVHDQIEAQTIRCLARRDIQPHEQACIVDAGVDLGPEAAGGSENDSVDRFPDSIARDPENAIQNRSMIHGFTCVRCADGSDQALVKRPKSRHFR